ncbi:hypothetical protein K1719_028695 [Acacia pycnantha]|nr:hypothetical protein K1719_028695 [Acacia pycnantha]
MLADEKEDKRASKATSSLPGRHDSKAKPSEKESESVSDSPINRGVSEEDEHGGIDGMREAKANKVCKEVTDAQKKQAKAQKQEAPKASSSSDVRSPPDFRQLLFPAIVDRRVKDDSSDDENEP